jgi:hypothetical protein
MSDPRPEQPFVHEPPPYTHPDDPEDPNDPKNPPAEPEKQPEPQEAQPISSLRLLRRRYVSNSPNSETIIYRPGNY